MVAAMLVDRTSAARAGAAGNAVRPWWFTIAKTLHSLPGWAQHALAIGMIVLSFLLRDAFVGGREAYTYVFFMPAILLASTVLSAQSGIDAADCVEKCRPILWWSFERLF